MVSAAPPRAEASFSKGRCRDIGVKRRRAAELPVQPTDDIGTFPAGLGIGQHAAMVGRTRIDDDRAEAGDAERPDRRFIVPSGKLRRDGHQRLLRVRDRDPRLVDHLGQAREAQIRKAEPRGRDSEPGHVHRGKAGLLD